MIYPIGLKKRWYECEMIVLRMIDDDSDGAIKILLKSLKRCYGSIIYKI